MSVVPHSAFASRATRLFLILSGFFVANALIAEFIGVKIFALEGTLGEPVANELAAALRKAANGSLLDNLRGR